MKLLLYKPTSPSPCSTTLPLKKGEEQITFHSSVFNCSEIIRTRLSLLNANATKNYYWYSDDLVGTDKEGNEAKAFFNVSIQNEGEYGKKIIWQTQEGKFSEKMKHGYTIQNGVDRRALKDYSTYYQGSASIYGEALNAIVPYNSTNLWQMRLYEENCNNVIGYGFLENKKDYGTIENYAFKPYDSSTQKVKDKAYVQIRPHTNIYDRHATDRYNSTGGHPELMIYWDDNAKYSIRILGKEYPIKMYTFRNPTNASLTNADLDSYGDPLYGYAIIDYDDDLYKVLVAGTAYQILCNYIDSDEFYYTVTEQPTVTFTINGQDGLASTQQSPITVQYANPTFNIKYNTSYGILNHYCFTLFEKNSSGVYETIYSTKNVYSSNIVFNYNQFMSGHDYKIVASFVDNNQINIVKEVYIKAQYNQDSTNSYLTTKYYRDHHSVVLDWSKTLLITPSVTSNNAVSYGKIDDTDASNNYMSLQSDNEIAYTQIDGEDSLDFKDNTVYLRIKLFPDYIGKICEVADDSGNIKSIEYDGIKLIAKINGKEKFYFYLYDTHNDWDGCENYKYYSTLETALQSKDDNLSMPFVYSEDNPTEFNWGDDSGIVYYWHEERPVSSHWYLVVLSNESFQVQDLEKE